MTSNDKLNLIIRMQLCQMSVSEACEGCPYKGLNCGSALIAAAKEAIQKEAVNDDTLLDDTITKILLEIGATQGYAGWEPTVAAIKLAAEDPKVLIGVHRGLYHAVADICGVAPMRVERNIRYLIERAWERGDYSSAVKYFGSSIHPAKGRPTVREFIARIADAANREVAKIRG